MKKQENFPEWKRWTLACSHAFITGFVLSVGPQIHDLSVADLKNGVLWSIIATAIFAGVKLAFEQAAIYLKK